MAPPIISTKMESDQSDNSCKQLEQDFSQLSCDKTSISPVSRTGYVDCLTDEQEICLMELWAMVIELLSSSVSDDSIKTKKKNFKELTEVLSKNASSHSVSSIEATSAGRSELMRINNLAIEFWNQLATDNPDVLLLRFLRARKWNVREAFLMFYEALKWRHSYGVMDLLKRGDGDGVKRQLMESGKGFFWGVDNEKRLVVFLPARLHDRYAQTLEENMAHTVYLMEMGRRSMLPGVETVTLVFDLADATLSSFDPSSMQFMIQCFQSYYPESLGRCFILNAPWIFWGFWRIIKPWLDPVVVSKITFVEDPSKDLAQFIDTELLLTEYGGNCTYRYKYYPPQPHHAPRQPPTPARIEELEDELSRYKPRLIDATLHLHILLNNADHVFDEGVLNISELKNKWREERVEAIEKVRKAMKELEEFSVPPHFYQRIGIVKDNGEYDWIGYLESLSPATSTSDFSY